MLTPQQAIAARGIDAKSAIRNLNRRLRYRSQEIDTHGAYVFANHDRVGLCYWRNRYMNPDRDSYALSDLKRASVENNVQLYVKAWTFLNGLVEC